MLHSCEALLAKYQSMSEIWEEKKEIRRRSEKMGEV